MIPQQKTPLPCNHITQEPNLLPPRHQNTGTVLLNARLHFLLPLGQTAPEYKEIHLKHLDRAGLLAFHYRCCVNHNIYQTRKVLTKTGWLTITAFCIVHAEMEAIDDCIN